MEQQKKEIERRMKAIDTIKEGRALSARILFDLTNIVKDNVWFRNFNKADDKFQIEGVSLENESIADLMEKLSKIPYMRNIELLNIEDDSFYVKDETDKPTKGTVGKIAETDKPTKVTVKKFIINGEIAF